ncbi:MAG: transcriptional regulator, family [Actinomycetia bacterium]|nr:transcriptional regulator, family [Actinomycetes bacterium]
MSDRSTHHFGPLLRRHRLAAGLSQAELAERAGLSPDAIRALESGRRATPRPYTVRALAEALALAEEDRLQLYAAAQTEPPSPEALPIPDTPAAGGERGRFSSPPRPPTRLIGREREVAAITYALRSGQARLVTLTGTGGVGKTRLALAVAEAIAADFPDGVAWVELAQIIGPAQEAIPLVAGAIARALGTREPAPQAVAASLAAAIGARKLLLMLDNFEHLLAAAPLLAAVLADCPALVLVVTSRECLRLRGEREFVVQPLAVPNPEEAAGDEATGVHGVAAVRLFVERAVEVRGDFALTAANTAAVATVCRHLDGLPLAIELAVRWLKVLPPEALAERLVPRLPLLAGGGGDRPDRQQTMRDTIAWSYQLLQPEEQRLFRRLGVSSPWSNSRPAARKRRPAKRTPTIARTWSTRCAGRLGHKRVHSTDSRSSMPMCAPPWSGLMLTVRSPRSSTWPACSPGSGLAGATCAKAAPGWSGPWRRPRWLPLMTGVVSRSGWA